MNQRDPRRILVVEDEDDIRFVVSQHLELSGYEVSVAVNGKEGLELARQTKPDLIISDITMPIMTGFDMLKALRADEQLRGIPVILHSVMVESRYAQKAQELGAAFFLKKPCNIDEMLAAIQACLPGSAASGA